MGQAAECAINKVVNMASAILMQAWMICHKDTLSIDFGQRKWTMLYRSKVVSPIYSMVYKPLREDKSPEVIIKVYHTDNGIFNNPKFIDYLLKNHRKIRFSGANK